MNLEIPDNLEDQIADLYRRAAETERRMQNKKRTGKIIEVDAKKGLARVELEKDPVTGKRMKTRWLPWKEIAAGKIKTHIPPSIDEIVDVVSESGDLTDAMIDTSVPSTANPRPHDKEAEAVITVGDLRILYKDGQAKISIGDDVSLDMTRDGLTLTAGGTVLAVLKGGATLKGNLDQDGIHTDSLGVHPS